MRKRNNIFPGMLLIVVGVIFLGFNYNLIRFDYTFRQVASFWPLLLILGGLAVLFNERRSFYNPVTALLVAFAIPLAIYSFASDGVDDIKSNLKKEFDFNFEDKWDGEDYSQSSKSGERIEQDFEVPYSPLVERVKLKIGGGAAEFHLAESEKGIFEAKTMLNAGTYRLSEELKDGFQDIDFEMKGHKRGFRFSDGEWHNEVYLKLSKKPVWELELGIGAGDLTFDLSGHKVDKLEIKTGAAAVDVKLGDLMMESKVKIESGVAKVKLAVPKEVGCEIEMDGALNSKDFEGFNKVSGSRYQTDNFDTSEKKIFIKVSSGLSAVTVSRY
jgi:hypothetical protein